MFTDRNYNVIVLAVLAALTAACDKAQLLAPTQSTITVSAPTRVLPSNGTTPVTASVIEQAGTPVQNGTTVRFTTTLGRVDPVEVQTVNGLAITTFFAGPNSGRATISATSGAATGGEGETRTNTIEITIGAAAVETVTVRATPGSIGPNGGTVQLIATVVGTNGQPVEGVTVTFTADQGSLASTTAVTNTSGEARTTLTTSQQTVVTATAGTKTSSNLTIAARAGPIVSITCAPATGTGNCAAIQASISNNTATVIFTVTRPTGSSALRSAVLDFGDGTSQALGNLAGGTTTVTHTYNGSDTSNPRAYTATVLATDINGETASVSISVVVTPRPTPTPINVAITAASQGNATVSGQQWNFTANVTGGGESGTGNAAVERYDWDFGDGDTATTSGATTSHVYDAEATEQRRIVTVTIRTQDGRTATGRTEILVDSFP
jgi:adhesin/invasin